TSKAKTGCGSAPSSVGCGQSAMSSYAPSTLPAVRIDVHGHRHVDLRAVIALALPLFANASLQAVRLLDFSNGSPVTLHAARRADATIGAYQHVSGFTPK
ncbi:MAG: hypothetical protein ABIU95_10290, partial [Burkholderiales bacterium]